MAKAVKLRKGQEFVFAAPKRGGGGEAKYPWDQWFDGTLIMLERSEGEDNDKGTIEAPTVKKDFEVSVNSMVPKLHTAARRRYKVVQISRTDVDGNRLKDALIIRARDMDADERVAEDLLRAEEKEKARDRRRTQTKSNGAAE